MTTDSAHYELCNIILDLDYASRMLVRAHSYLESLHNDKNLYRYEFDYYERDAVPDLIAEARNTWRLALMIDDVLLKHSAHMFNEGAIYGDTHGERF